MRMAIRGAGDLSEADWLSWDITRSLDDHGVNRAVRGRESKGSPVGGHSLKPLGRPLEGMFQVGIIAAE